MLLFQQEAPPSTRKGTLKAKSVSPLSQSASPKLASEAETVKLSTSDEQPSKEPAVATKVPEAAAKEGAKASEVKNSSKKSKPVSRTVAKSRADAKSAKQGDGKTKSDFVVDDVIKPSEEDKKSALSDEEEVSGPQVSAVERKKKSLKDIFCGCTKKRKA